MRLYGPDGVLTRHGARFSTKMQRVLRPHIRAMRGRGAEQMDVEHAITLAACMELLLYKSRPRRRDRKGEG